MRITPDSKADDQQAKLCNKQADAISSFAYDAVDWDSDVGPVPEVCSVVDTLAPTVGERIVG